MCRDPVSRGILFARFRTDGKDEGCEESRMKVPTHVG